MTDIVRTANEFYIGDLLTNYAYQTQFGYAITDIPAAKFEEKLRFDEYQNVNNVFYLPAINGVVLMFDYEAQNMQLSQFTVAQGDFNTTKISVERTPDSNYIHAYNASANHITDITSNYLLPATPSFHFQFHRMPMTPANMDPADQEWRLSFGGGYTLMWKRMHDGPELYYNNKLISSYIVDLEDAEKYATDSALYWKIYNLMGRLYIICSAFRNPWIIDDIGELPAATFRVQGAGGEYAFNLTPYTFATSGYFETDLVEHIWNYDSGDLVGTVFPSLPSNCTATITVVEEVGTSKRYRVALTGPGTTTPVVQAFEYLYMPEFSTPSAVWKNITPWVYKDQGTETMPKDLSARSLSINLVPDKIINGQNLWDFVGGLNGQYAFKYKIGYQYANGSTDTQDRMQGVLTVNDYKLEVKKFGRLTLTAVDKWERLAGTALLFAPNLTGLRVDVAIALIAKWGGIPSTHIASEAINIYIDEPVTDATRIPWLAANGTSAGDFIRQLATTYGAVVEFDEDGVLQIRNGYNTASQATYRYDEGATLDEAIISVEEHEDTQGAKNIVMVEGQTEGGRPFFATVYDIESIQTSGAGGFLGRPSVHYERKPDCTTAASAREAAIAIFREVNRGWPRRTIRSKIGDLWKAWPNQYITLINTAGHGTEDVLITEITGKLGAVINEHTATGEVRG
jgi:hypothetical protein